MEDEVRIPIEDALDLHAFRPADVRNVVLDYLEAARERHFPRVRLIHGRGTGFQRQMIRQLLAALDWVESFHDAEPSGGGWGATVVLLRSLTPPDPATESPPSGQPARS
jgi:DNA-nicking Smr family endonuclease